MQHEGMDVPATLRAIIKARPGTRQEWLATELETSQATISRWITGKQKPGYDEGLRIERLAATVGVTVAGRAPGAQPYKVKIAGLVGAGEEVEWFDTGSAALELGEVDLPFAVPDDCVALEAKGDSMAPRVKNGELLVVRRNGSKPSDMLGEEAVVKLTDGTYLFKTIRRGYEAGLFNLESFNAPLRENADIEWVAEVWAIVPPQRWTRQK